MKFVAEKMPLSKLFKTEGAKEVILDYARNGVNPFADKKSSDDEIFESIKKAYKGKEDNYHSYLFFDENHIPCGLLLFWTIYDEHVRGIVAEVDSIFSTEKSRKKGCGAVILKTLKTEARNVGCRGIYLCTPYGTELSKALAKRFLPVFQISYMRV